MISLRPLGALLWVGLAASIPAAIPAAAFAYGAAGHRIAGALAEPLLCPAAAEEVARISGGRSLSELGVWADTIRDEPRWRNTGPWHYLNIDDGRPLSSYRHPPEGDVLLAIERSAHDLARGDSAGSSRLDALRFLVHFIVDLHQPLHVGRASDRGGNTIDVRYGATTVNLHRFWDTDVLEVAGLSRREYERALAPKVAALGKRPQAFSPEAWAAESLAVRKDVYAFKRRGRAAAVLDRGYLDRADAITRERLSLAAVRVAFALDTVLGCD